MLLFGDQPELLKCNQSTFLAQLLGDLAVLQSELCRAGEADFFAAGSRQRTDRQVAESWPGRWRFMLIMERKCLTSSITRLDHRSLWKPAVTLARRLGSLRKTHVLAAHLDR
jgi:predicted nucleic acid-binding Zn ribbon protein